MGVANKLRRELGNLVTVTAFFGAWVALLALLKRLILAEYHVAFAGFAAAAVGVLVLSKVVLVLEHVNLGGWALRAPAWQGILARTLLYALGVFVVLVAEKLVHEIRAGAGSLGEAWAAALAASKFAHAMANTLAVTSALLVYNFLAVVRRYLGGDGLVGVLRRPPPPDDAPNLPASGSGRAARA